MELHPRDNMCSLLLASCFLLPAAASHAMQTSQTSKKSPAGNAEGVANPMPPAFLPGNSLQD